MRDPTDETLRRAARILASDPGLTQWFVNMLDPDEVVAGLDLHLAVFDIPRFHTETMVTTGARDAWTLLLQSMRNYLLDDRWWDEFPTAADRLLAYVNNFLWVLRETDACLNDTDVLVAGRIVPHELTIRARLHSLAADFNNSMEATAWDPLPLQIARVPE